MTRRRALALLALVGGGLLVAWLWGPLAGGEDQIAIDLPGLRYASDEES